MKRPVVGVITFGDPREHEWNTIYYKLAPPRHKEIVEFLKTLDLDVVSCEEVARSNKQIDEQAEYLKQQGVECFIAHTPCWAWPSTLVRGVQMMDMETIIMGNDDPGTHSTVGLLGTGGALDQIGKKHLRIHRDFKTTPKEYFENKMMPYIKAASAKKQVIGTVFGLFGGRSLGIDTGTFDPMQWRKLFKIDTDHIDQLEIIRLSDQVDKAEEDKMFDWLVSNVKEVRWNEKLTEDKLRFQIRCYIATKRIIKERKLDFIAIKCMPDLTNNYVPQCLSAAFLPGPYDHEGEKMSIAMGCEADADGALTMQMLSGLAGGHPTFFGDLSHIDYGKQVLYLPNCGGMCTWYADRSCDACKNLAKVELRQANRPAGGAVTYMVPKAGTMTLARLYRKDGKYYMAIIPGEMIIPEKADYDRFVESRGVHQLPVGFFKTTADCEDIVAEFGSNHISGMAGNYEKELVYLCEFLDIVPVVMK